MILFEFYFFLTLRRWNMYYGPWFIKKLPMFVSHRLAVVCVISCLPVTCLIVSATGKLNWYCWCMDPMVVLVLLIPSLVINFNVWSCRPVVPQCMKRLQRRRRQLKRLTLKHMKTIGMKAMKSPMVTKIWLNDFKSRTGYAWDASDILILAKKASTFKSWSF